MPMMTRRAAMAAGLGCAVGLTAAGGGAAASAGTATAPVETTLGKVRGRRANGVSSFLGVPYGDDTAKHRFQPAGPAKAWTGVRDCAAIGPQAPQGPVGMAGGLPKVMTPFAQAVMTTFRTGLQEGNESEDCLVLNVFTPDASTARKRPVMVWLHGGGFAMGSAGEAQYDGGPLCRRGDVVVVTLNHRLNALGYLYLGALHDDFADSGNVGQLDQVLALQWVRDNIAAFGGDPGNVTIFGESGGGRKVSVLLAMPPAKGLFHKAIVQSGPGVTVGEKAAAAELAERTLAGLGLAKADVHQLQTMEAAAIIKAASAAEGRGRSLAPMLDGRSVPAHPFSPAATEISRDVPVIVGTNKDEATLFLSADPTFGKMTEADAKAHFTAMLGEKGAAAFPVYQGLRPNDPPTYWVTALATDMMMRMDSIRLASRKAAQGAAPVYMYRLDWETPVLDGVMRSPHGLDVPLVFDTVESKRTILGPGPAPEQLAPVMSQAWIDFARTGDPSQQGLAWPRYEATGRQTMIFDTESRVVSDPDAAARRFWGA
jgi:para-nitrobenzyl esterase